MTWDVAARFTSRNQDWSPTRSAFRPPTDGQGGVWRMNKNMARGMDEFVGLMLDIMRPCPFNHVLLGTISPRQNLRISNDLESLVRRYYPVYRYYSLNKHVHFLDSGGSCKTSLKFLVG